MHQTVLKRTLRTTELYGVTMLNLLENIGVIPLIKISDGASRSSSSVARAGPRIS